MLSARAPLTMKNENSLSGRIGNMSLDKENTVRTEPESNSGFSFFSLNARCWIWNMADTSCPPRSDRLCV